jgi:hypothetical protein
MTLEKFAGLAASPRLDIFCSAFDIQQLIREIGLA